MKKLFRRVKFVNILQILKNCLLLQISVRNIFIVSVFSVVLFTSLPIWGIMLINSFVVSQDLSNRYTESIMTKIESELTYFFEGFAFIFLKYNSF